MKRMLWIDLEMTGLDPESCAIIELAAIVTDLKLEPLATYHSVVFQPKSLVEAMDEWNTRTHGASGLLAKIPNGKAIVEVEEDMCAFVTQHFPDEKPVMCGNSIHQDRKFIDRYMMDFSNMLHYRLIDVSSFKQIYEHMFDVKFDKKGDHRALDDILESMAELKHYLEFIQVPTGPETV